MASPCPGRSIEDGRRLVCAAPPIILAEEERKTLTQLAKPRAASLGLARRAQIVLRAAGSNRTRRSRRRLVSDALACRPGLWMPRAKAWAACPGTPGRRVRPRTEKDDRGRGVVGDGRRMGSGAPPDDPWMPPIKPARGVSPRPKAQGFSRKWGEAGYCKTGARGARDHCRAGPLRARDCHPPSGPTGSRRLGDCRDATDPLKGLVGRPGLEPGTT